MTGIRPAWLLTVPLPAPAVPLVILIVNGPLRNLACALRSAVIGVRQVPVPVQYAAHPANEWPILGVAVSVTLTPLLYCAWHPVAAGTPAVMVQLMPRGFEVTTPVPVPAPVIVSVLRTMMASSGSVGFGASWQPCTKASAPTAPSRTEYSVNRRVRRMRQLAGGRCDERRTVLGGVPGSVRAAHHPANGRCTCAAGRAAECMPEVRFRPPVSVRTAIELTR